MCQTLDTVFHPSSHLLPSYKKYGLRLVFRWFLGFVYSCDHQTTSYKTLNNRHTPPLKSEPKKISLRSINKYPTLKIWISDENTASPFRYITYSAHWLVYSSLFLVKMSLIYMRMKNHFHIKGWALNLVFIKRLRGTRKWPTSPDKRNLCKLPFRCPWVQTFDLLRIFWLARYPRGNLFKESTFLSKNIIKTICGMFHQSLAVNHTRPFSCYLKEQTNKEVKPIDSVEYIILPGVYWVI